MQTEDVITKTKNAKCSAANSLEGSVLILIIISSDPLCGQLTSYVFLMVHLPTQLQNKTWSLKSHPSVKANKDTFFLPSIIYCFVIIFMSCSSTCKLILIHCSNGSSTDRFKSQQKLLKDLYEFGVLKL